MVLWAIVGLYFYLVGNSPPGSDPGFSFGGGGGGANDYMRERSLQARNPKSLSAGVQGPLKGPGSSRGFLMLSSAI